MIRTTPYEGTDPHATINGHEGDLIVKRNFRPVAVTKDEVLFDPDTHLATHTFMFRREAAMIPGVNWFWVNYLPDGSFDQAPNDMALTRRGPKA